MARLIDSCVEGRFPTLYDVNDRIFRIATSLAAFYLFPTDQIQVDLFTTDRKNFYASASVFDCPNLNRDPENTTLFCLPLNKKFQPRAFVVTIANSNFYLEKTGRLLVEDYKSSNINWLASAISQAKNFVKFSCQDSEEFKNYKKKISDAIFRTAILRNLMKFSIKNSDCEKILATLGYILCHFYENNFSKTQCDFAGELDDLTNGYNLILNDVNIKGGRHELSDFLSTLSFDMSSAACALGLLLSLYKSDFSTLNSGVTFSYSKDEAGPTYGVKTGIGIMATTLADLEKAHNNPDQKLSQKVMVWENEFISQVKQEQKAYPQFDDDFLNNLRFMAFNTLSNDMDLFMVIRKPITIEKLLTDYANYYNLNEYLEK